MISLAMDRPQAKRLYYQMKRLSKCFETVFIRNDGMVLCDKRLMTILPYGKHYALLHHSVFEQLLDEGEWIHLNPMQIIDPIKKDANLKHVTRLYWDEDSLYMELLGESHGIGKRIRALDQRLLDYIELTRVNRSPQWLSDDELSIAFEGKLDLCIQHQNLDYSKFLTPGLNLKESQVGCYPMEISDALSRVVGTYLNPDYVQPWVFEHHRHDTTLFHLYVYIRTDQSA